jgi:hypothetical protein
MFKSLLKTGILIVALAGCATSVHRALDEVRPGADKDIVLGTAGNPTRTFRENGQDHWIYVYYQKDQPWLRDVIFEDGQVTRVTRPAAAKESWQKDLERAKSMEEFEHKAREHQRKSEARDGR